VLGCARILVTVIPADERFFQYVQPTGFCWEWTGGMIRGYGAFYFEGRKVYAHRWAYEHLVGPIGDGLVLDHLCRNKVCVNPDHVEPVTNEENLRRGYSFAARATRTGTCYRGHPLDYTRKDGNGRICNTCRNERRRTAYARDPEKVLVKQRAKRASRVGV
jgi:HNH endonuclease